jgi:hypothetical protein
MWTPHRVEQFVERIIARLGDIEQALNNQKDAIDAAAKSYKDERRDEPRVTVARPPTDAEAKSAREEKKQDRTIQKVIAFATCATAIAAIIYGGIAAVQACLMRESVRQVKRQLDDSRANQRAILVGDATWDPQRGVITYTLKNIGHSAAVGMTNSFSGGSGKAIDSHKRMGGALLPLEEVKERIKPLCQVGGALIVPEGDKPWTSEASVDLPPEVVKGDAYFYRYMNFAYSDIFGVEWYGYVCMRYNFILHTFVQCSVPDFANQKCKQD